MMWASDRLGQSWSDIEASGGAIVEGDDGIMPQHIADPSIWSELGFELSSELRGNKPGDCDFLHRLWTEHGAVVDIYRTCFRMLHVKKSASLSRRKQLAILRCCGLSMYHLAPGCPVVTAMVNLIGKYTAGINEFTGIERYLGYQARKSLEFYGSLSRYPRHVDVNELLRPVVSEGREGFPPILSALQIYLERLIHESSGEIDIGEIFSAFPDFHDTYAMRDGGDDTLFEALGEVGVSRIGYDQSTRLLSTVNTSAFADLVD
jgi:hypothetical protein